MLQTSLATELKHRSWYLDSGCSQHMTGRRHMFKSLELKPEGTVGFGGNQKGKITGFGTIGNGSLPSIHNVLLVKGLMHNLLSISQLSDNGYDIIFNKKIPNLLVIRMVMYSSMVGGRTTFIKLDFLI